MAAMNQRLVVLLLCASLLPAMQAWAKTKTILPDACGDDGVNFDVETKKDQPPPVPPTSAQAQIVFIETMSKAPGCIGCDLITRVGVDGSWVGANKGNSYFTLTVAPGVHHLCIAIQSWVGRYKKGVSVESFTAEPGKVYYYETTLDLLLLNYASGPGMASTGRGGSPGLVFSQLSEDEGKYRVKAWKLATSKIQEPKDTTYLYK
jgi:hypothetical protein